MTIPSNSDSEEDLGISDSGDDSEFGLEDLDKVDPEELKLEADLNSPDRRENALALLREKFRS